jgi:hypothetical protein
MEHDRLDNSTPHLFQWHTRRNPLFYEASVHRIAHPRSRGLLDQLAQKGAVDRGKKDRLRGFTCSDDDGEENRVVGNEDHHVSMRSGLCQLFKLRNLQEALESATQTNFLYEPFSLDGELASALDPLLHFPPVIEICQNVATISIESPEQTF